MSEATFTFRVDEALKNDFATAAKARDRTAAQLLRDFMRSFVQQQAQSKETTDEVESMAINSVIHAHKAQKQESKSA